MRGTEKITERREREEEEEERDRQRHTQFSGVSVVKALLPS